MPTYCYSVPDGITVERDFKMGEAPPSIVLDDGLVAERDLRAEHLPRNASHPGWPLECIGSGVNAAQAGELRKFFKDSKFDCEVSMDGNPIYRDPQHRKRALKLRGFFDKASYC